jgi:ketosteroid isomerase-like protein
VSRFAKNLESYDAGNRWNFAGSPEPTMSTALDITKQAYEAFGRRDIPAFLKLVADEVDWKLIGPASWPHAGLRRNPAEVAAFFADLDRFEI